MAALTRLRTALSDGSLVLPDGPVWVMRPPIGYDLGGVADPIILQTAFPDHAAWQGAGFTTDRTGPVAAAIVVAPRSKALARSMVAEACAHAVTVIVDGPKTNGIDSLWTAVKKRIGTQPSVTKDHGRLFWFNATTAFDDWASPGPTKGAHGFFTQPGVFSEDKIDAGSTALARALPTDLKGRVADLGAGWGFLSATLLDRAAITEITLVEAEALAMDCARLNVMDDRASFVWGDATTFQDAPFDHVVMNPPFHSGREGDPKLGQAFIQNAASLLKPKGSLWMVANRHLPYEATLDQAFGRVEELPGAPGFKIFHAQRPRR